MSAEPIQAVVVEDHDAVRRGLELILPRAGIRVTGTASSAAAGLDLVRRRAPAVAVIDVDLGGESGLELARRIASEQLSTAVVLYTGMTDVRLLDSAAADAVGAVVLKTAPLETLVAAIAAVAGGGSFVDPSLQKLVAAHRRRPSVLSSREVEVLGLLADGLRVAQIAELLVLSPLTIQTHVRNAARKLGVHGQLQTVLAALRTGELDTPDLAGRAASPGR